MLSSPAVVVVAGEIPILQRLVVLLVVPESSSSLILHKYSKT